MTTAEKINDACARFEADIGAIGAKVREDIARGAEGKPSAVSVKPVAPTRDVDAERAGFKKGFAAATKALTEGVSFAPQVFRMSGKGRLPIRFAMVPK